ncbi:MAG: type I glyceraldehyde-3-phosphate dehydrogenase, partial [Candidatus Ranarchaeia archaeon]
DVSLLDFIVKTHKPASLAELINRFKDEARGRLNNILEIETAPLVSADFKSSSYSSIVDVQSSMQITNHLFRIVSWYDNEYGYALRTAELVQYIGQ